MKKAIMLNTPELPVVGTLYFQVSKFLSSFHQLGYEVLEISDIDSFLELSPGFDDIVYVSNHGISHSSPEAYRMACNSLQRISKFECTYLLWFFHDFLDTQDMPHMKRWILTGEHFRREPKTSPHLKFWNIQRSIPNYVPMTFASSIHTDHIGNIPRSESLLASFVGSPYKSEWCMQLSKEKNNVSIYHTPPFMDERTRISIFLSSVTSLGFHSDNNVLNSVLVERVFEGMSLGCIVVSDNSVCEDVTDGNVKYVASYEQLVDELDRYWANPTERRQRQIASMSWCKSYGTYKNVAENFIKMSRSI